MIPIPLGTLGFIPSNPYLAWNRRQLALVSGLALLTAAALVPAVWIVRELFDAWIPAGNSRAALLGCIGLLVIRAATAGLIVLQRQAGMRLAKESTTKLRTALARRILEVDPRVLDTLDNARVQTRIVKGTERIDVMLNRLTSVVIPAASTAIIAAAGMVLISPVLSAVEVAVVAVVLLAHRRHSARVRRSVLGFQDAFESYAASTAFLIRHAELIRSRGFEDGELRRQESVVERLRDRSNDMADAHVQNGQIQSVLVGWMAIAALIVGGQQVIAGHSTVGTLAGFYFASALGAQALLQIVSARSDLISGRFAMERMTELWTSLQPATPMGSGNASSVGAARVELRNVYVDYDDRAILRDLDLTLRPGEHISVSGPNGAGKTTLLRVMLGLLPPRSGQVLVDGRDLDDLNRSDIRKRIGLAPQRPTFFGGTIAENITYGRPEASAEDIRWTLETVGLANLVDTLPAGMHSAIGDEGVRLSGGEAQRASIARALIGRPELLVLDEPGNHLTTVDLAEILGAIRRALPQATIVTVGHDDTCARIADRALMLHDGALTDCMSVEGLSDEWGREG